VGKNGWSEGDKKKKPNKAEWEGKKKREKESGRRCKLRKGDRERETEKLQHILYVFQDQRKNMRLNSFIPD